MSSNLRPAALAWLLLAGTASAQTATKPDSGWVLGLDAQEAYESNIQYRADGEDDFVTRAGATFGRHFVLKRSRLGLELGGGGLFYQSHPELNLFTWTVAADGARQLTRRLSIHADGRSSRGYARDTAVLDQTVVPPYAVTRTDGGAFSVRYKFVRDLEARLEAEGDHVDFSSPGFVNGWTVATRARIDQATEHSWGWGAAAEYERTSNAGQEYEIERLFGTWRANVTRGVTTRLQAGLAGFRLLHSPDPTLDLDTNLTPMAAAELAGQLGRHTLAVRLAREVEQTYGLGVVGVTYDARLAYGLSLGPRLGLFAGGEYVDFLAGASRVTGPTRALRANAGARHALSDGWALQADYSYWHWYDPLAGWGSHTAALSVRRGFAWR